MLTEVHKTQWQNIPDHYFHDELAYILCPGGITMVHADAANANERFVIYLFQTHCTTLSAVFSLTLTHSIADNNKSLCLWRGM